MPISVPVKGPGAAEIRHLWNTRPRGKFTGLDDSVARARGLMRPALDGQRLRTEIDENQTAAGRDDPARITREASGTFR